MKKIILILCLCLSVSAIAQNKNEIDKDSNVNKTIQEFSSKIDSVITGEKSKMEAQISSVNEKLEKKLISKESAKSKKDSLSQYYADVINEKISVFKTDLDKIIQAQVKESLTKEGGADINLTKEELMKKYNKKEFSFGIDYQLGMSLMHKNNNIFSTDSNLDPGFMASMAFMFKFHHGRTNPISYVAKFGVNGVTFGIKHNKFLNIEANNDAFLTTSETNLKQSNFASWALHYFLGAEYSLNKKKNVGKEVWYRNTNGGWSLGAGLYYNQGFNLTQGAKFINENGKTVTQKNSFRSPVQNAFGAQLSVRYKYFYLYINKDLTAFMSKYKSDYNKTFSIGLGFMLL